MNTLSQIIAIIIGIILVVYLIRFIKHNPEMFSLDNLNRSVFTLGVLCLMLIGFIAFLVWLVKV